MLYVSNLAIVTVIVVFILNTYSCLFIAYRSVIATNGGYDINSVVIDFSIEPTPSSLQRPLIIKFEHVQVCFTCVYPVLE